MTLNVLARVVVLLALVLPAGALAETDDMPLPDRNPARVKGAASAEHPVLPGDEPTVPWTDTQVAAAEADCSKLLAGLALDYEKLAPIKQGICGAPAPILLKSIGSDPKVAIEPPATMTCKLAAGLSVWLSKTVQPNARALVGAPVVKLHNATSYACRNRYGGETTPLSEHALANALDVSEFVFQTGERVSVLASWPHEATPHVATVAQGPKPKDVAIAPPPPSRQPSGGEVTGDYTSSITAVSTTSLGMSLVKPIAATVKANPFVVPVNVVIDPKTNPFVVPTAAAKAGPSAPPASPKPETPALPASEAEPDAKSKFVKAVHDDACNVFGTVLGPEANAAHKNHFHLDMKARRHAALCQ